MASSEPDHFSLLAEQFQDFTSDVDIYLSLSRSTELFRGISHFGNFSYFTDLVVSVDQETFPCHRIVLSSMSDWMWKLLQPNANKATTSTVTIPPELGLSANTFRNILSLIYQGGSFAFSPDDCIDMAKAAWKLEMPFIKAVCLQKAERIVLPQSSFRFYELAAVEGLERLADKALTILLKEAFADAGPTWQESVLQFPVELMLVLLSDPDLVTSDTILMTRLIQWYCEDKQGRKEHIGLLLPFVCFTALKVSDVNEWRRLNFPDSAWKNFFCRAMQYFLMGLAGSQPHFILWGTCTAYSGRNKPKEHTRSILWIFGSIGPHHPKQTAANGTGQTLNDDKSRGKDAEDKTIQEETGKRKPKSKKKKKNVSVGKQDDQDRREIRNISKKVSEGRTNEKETRQDLDVSMDTSGAADEDTAALLQGKKASEGRPDTAERTREAVQQKVEESSAMKSSQRRPSRRTDFPGSVCISIDTADADVKPKCFTTTPPTWDLGVGFASCQWLNSVYVSGGDVDPNNFMSFHFFSGYWAYSHPRLPSGRVNHCMVASKDKIFLIGGRVVPASLTTHETASSVGDKDEMTGRDDNGQARRKGNIAEEDGKDSNLSGTSPTPQGGNPITGDIYTLDAGREFSEFVLSQTPVQWQYLGFLDYPVEKATAAVLGHKIYVCGGCLANGLYLRKVQVYDTLNSVCFTVNLPQEVPAYNLRSVSTGGRVFLICKDGKVLRMRDISDFALYQELKNNRLMSKNSGGTAASFKPKTDDNSGPDLHADETKNTETVITQAPCVQEKPSVLFDRGEKERTQTTEVPDSMGTLTGIQNAEPKTVETRGSGVSTPNSKDGEGKEKAAENKNDEAVSENRDWVDTTKESAESEEMTPEKIPSSEPKKTEIMDSREKTTPSKDTENEAREEKAIVDKDNDSLNEEKPTKSKNSEEKTTAKKDNKENTTESKDNKDKTTDSKDNEQKTVDPKCGEGKATVSQIGEDSANQSKDNEGNKSVNKRIQEATSKEKQGETTINENEDSEKRTAENENSKEERSNNVESNKSKEKTNTEKTSYRQNCEQETTKSKGHDESEETSKMIIDNKDRAKKTTESVDEENKATAKNNMMERKVNGETTDNKDSEKTATESKDSEQKVTESKDSEQKATESKDSQQKATESKDSEQKATESKDSQQKATESKDSEQKATESKDSQQKATESKDSQQKATESKDSQQKATESKDSQQKATESKDSQQKATESKDSQQKATESKDSQQKATESKDSEQKATESKDSQQKATESKDSQQKATESKDSQQKATESKDSEQKATESKGSEEKATESKDSEQKAAESGDSEENTTESKDSEETATESGDSEDRATESKDCSEEKASENKDSEKKATESKDNEEKATESKESEEKATESKDSEEMATESKDSDKKTKESKGSEENRTESKDNEENTTESKHNKEDTTESKDKENTTESKDNEENTTESKHNKEDTTESKDKENTTESKDNEENTTESKHNKEDTTESKDKENRTESKDNEENTTESKHNKEDTTESKDKENTTESNDNEENTTESKHNKEDTTESKDKENTTESNDNEENTTESKDKENTTESKDEENSNEIKDKENTTESRDNKGNEETTTECRDGENITDSRDSEEKTTESKESDESLSEATDIEKNIVEKRSGQDKTNESKSNEKKTTESKDGQEKTTESKDGQEKTTESEDGQEKTTESKYGQEKTTESKDGQEKTTEIKDGQEKTTESEDSEKTTTKSKDNQEKTTGIKDSEENVRSAETNEGKTDDGDERKTVATTTEAKAAASTRTIAEEKETDVNKTKKGEVEPNPRLLIKDGNEIKNETDESIKQKNEFEDSETHILRPPIPTNTPVINEETGRKTQTEQLKRANVQQCSAESKRTDGAVTQAEKDAVFGLLSMTTVGGNSQHKANQKPSQTEDALQDTHTNRCEEHSINPLFRTFEPVLNEQHGPSDIQNIQQFNLQSPADQTDSKALPGMEDSPQSQQQSQVPAPLPWWTRVPPSQKHQPKEEPEEEPPTPAQTRLQTSTGEKELLRSTPDRLTFFPIASVPVEMIGDKVGVAVSNRDIVICDLNDSPKIWIVDWKTGKVKAVQVEIPFAISNFDVFSLTGVNKHMYPAMGYDCGGVTMTAPLAQWAEPLKSHAFLACGHQWMMRSVPQTCGSEEDKSALDIGVVLLAADEGESIPATFSVRIASRTKKRKGDHWVHNSQVFTIKKHTSFIEGFARLDKLKIPESDFLDKDGNLVLEGVVQLGLENRSTIA